MNSLVILGATGSIGTTCLNAIRDGKLKAKVVGLVANKSKDELSKLSKEFNCPAFTDSTNPDFPSFLKKCGGNVCLNGIAGANGFPASLRALECGYDLALANKESVVMGGSFLFKRANELGRRIYPVDSEHSAIYHLIKRHGDVKRLIITASGGPFLGKKNLVDVSVEDAIKHPTWKMGKKISIDSATLANKGLEVIEAGFLFGFNAEDIDVVIHRQSIVHSMAMMTSGAIYAQMSPPDMTLPIVSACSLSDEGLNDVVAPLSFDDLTLTFKKWDEEEFPLLKTAYGALRKRGSYPIAFNAANEVAVQAFISGKIKFMDIPKVVLSVMDEDWRRECVSEKEILSSDKAAREKANGRISSLAI